MYAHYEGIHKKQVIDCVSKGEWAAPPVTIELPQKQGYACITESALRNYPGMSLQADGNVGLLSDWAMNNRQDIRLLMIIVWKRLNVCLNRLSLQAIL